MAREVRAMTSERLAEIREMAAQPWTGAALLGEALAEVERLRDVLDALARQSRFEREQRDRRETALVALVAVARAVARASRLYSAPADMVGLPPTLTSPSATLIVPRDLQEQARALLASTGDERSGGAGG